MTYSQTRSSQPAREPQRKPCCPWHKGAAPGGVLLAPEPQLSPSPRATLGDGAWGVRSTSGRAPDPQRAGLRAQQGNGFRGWCAQGSSGVADKEHWFEMTQGEVVICFHGESRHTCHVCAPKKTCFCSSGGPSGPASPGSSTWSCSTARLRLGQRE